MDPFKLEADGFSFSRHSTGGPLTSVKMELCVDHYTRFSLVLRESSDPDASHGDGIYLSAEQMKVLGQYLLDAASAKAP
jgi:hypothetical protein